MSPTRRSSRIGTTTLLAGGHLSPVTASAIDQTDKDNLDSYLDSSEHRAWQAIEDEREQDPRSQRGVKEALIRMEIGVSVHDATAVMLGCVPVERPAHVKLFRDGGDRLAIWGAHVWWRKDAPYSNLTPDLHMTETFLDADTFAPIARVLFGTVDMDQEIVCNSAVAANWTRRRALRNW